MPLVDIYRSIYRFADYAAAHPELEFLVTKLGCGYAGYNTEDFIDIWRREEFPLNLVLPIEFQ